MEQGKTSNARLNLRRQAVEVLTDVIHSRKKLEDVLSFVLDKNSAQERAWLREVCSGVLRWRGRVDLAIHHYAKKRVTGWLYRVLCLSTYQVLAQDVEPQKVVNETVDWVKGKLGKAPSQFTNAILRRIVENRQFWSDSGWSSFYELGLRGVEKEAGWASMPIWLWEKLNDQFGPEQAKALAKTFFERPKLWLHGVNGFKPGSGFQQTSLAGAWVGDTQNIPSIQGYKGGEFFVQDLSSQYLIHEVARRADRGERFLDLCAAPGGKTFGLAWRGFDVVSTDRDKKRLNLLKENLDRLKNVDRVLVQNYDEVLASEEDFDWVWVDAPCTSMGLLKRHPEIKWLKEEEDVLSASRLQLDLANVGWSKVKPGGHLVFSVCSILKDEGEELDLVELLNGKQIQSWQILPSTPLLDGHSGDGFWCLILQKP